MNRKLQNLLAKLPSAKQVGDTQWESLCPAHDDSRPSLRIGCPNGKAILVCCQKGCKTPDVLRAVGLTMEDISSRAKSSGDSKAGKKKIVATFDYRDEKGELVFQVLRYDPKSFSQRRPAGDGKWTWNKSGCRVIPYRLRELLANPSQVVFVPEGEKHCDALAKLGFVATCNAGGAGKWTKEHAAFLQGRTVIILADNDARGRDHAAGIAKSLVGIAAPVKVLALPDLPEKGDVIDWLAKGGTKEELLRLAGDAPLASQLEGVGEAEQAGSEAAPVEPVRVITSAEFFSTVYRREYVVDGVLAENQPCLISGRSKSMKTSVAIDLVVSIATGTPFLGEFATKHRRVAILSGESGEETIQETARRIAFARGIDPATMDVFWGFDLPCLSSEAGLQSLEAMLVEEKVEVLFDDPIYLSLMGEETKGLNASNLFDVGPLLLRVAKLCRSLGVTPVLLHHNRKNSPIEKYGPPELEEMAMAGFAEFARQWILLGRREEYLEDGNHALHMVYGGSAGHAGRRALDIAEGLISDTGGRKWEVTLRTSRDADAEKKQTAQARKAAEKADRDAESRERLLAVLATKPGGETSNALRGLTKITAADRFNVITATLEADGAIERCKVTKGGKHFDGWKLVSDSAGNPQNGQPVEPVKSDFRPADRTAGESVDHPVDLPPLCNRGVETDRMTGDPPVSKPTHENTSTGQTDRTGCPHVWASTLCHPHAVGRVTIVCRLCGEVQTPAHRNGKPVPV